MSLNEPGFAVVLTTIPPELDAEDFARALVADRLAACVSVLPAMLSVYRWSGAIEIATERQVVVKTTGDCVGALRERLHALHPYEVPEFIVLRIEDGSEAYLGWVQLETRRP